MLKFLIKSQKGQTAVEYCLMIAMAVGLGITTFKKLNEYLIDNPNGMINGPIRNFQQRLGADDQGMYRRYQLGPR